MRVCVRESEKFWREREGEKEGEGERRARERGEGVLLVIEAIFVVRRHKERERTYIFFF